MLIHINNVPQELTEDVSLAEVVIRQNLRLEAVALVLNAEVVPRHRWHTINCQHDDKLEIFSAVAGG